MALHHVLQRTAMLRNTKGVPEMNGEIGSRKEREALSYRVQMSCFGCRSIKVCM